MGQIAMKLPKTVMIYGKPYTIKKDRTRNGAHVNQRKCEIIIGTSDKYGVLENFVHEVIEQILVDNHHRYDNHHCYPANKDMFFVFTHNEFENVIPQIIVALKDILK